MRTRKATKDVKVINSMGGISAYKYPYLITTYFPAWKNPVTVRINQPKYM